MPILQNIKWENFAQACAKGKAAAIAYKEAGYSPSYKNAVLLSQKQIVIDRIEEIRAKALMDCQLDVAKVVTELEKLGFSNMMDFMRIDERTGEPVLDFSRLTREQAAAIAEIIVEEVTSGHGEYARTTKRTKFKLHDKKAALDSLGRFLGMYVDRKEVKVGGVMFHVTKEDMAL